MKWRNHPAIQWFEQRTPRERMLLTAAAVAIVAAIWSEWGATALEKKTRTTRETLEARQRENSVLATELALLAQKAQPDFVERSERELAQLRAEIARLDEQLRAARTTLITAQETRALLSEIVQNAPVELVALERLPPEPFEIDSIPPEQRAELPRLIRHPFRLAVRGTFPQIVQFLRHVENLPRAPQWRRVAITTTRYPVLTLVMEVETLSWEEDWLAF